MPRCCNSNPVVTFPMKNTGKSSKTVDNLVQDCCMHVCVEQKLALSALTLLVGRQEGHPACKKLSGVVICVNAWIIEAVVGCWCGYLSGARCELAYSPADATATHCLLLQ